MKKICLLLLLAIMAALAVGCAPADTETVNNPEKNREAAPSADHPVEPTSLIAAIDDDAHESSVIVAGGANKFAFELSAQLAAEAGDDNLVFSPYSVWLPLAALLNATDTETKEKALAILAGEGITEEDVNIAASRMLYNLTGEDGGYSGESYNPLKIANAIFVSDKYTLKDSFARKFSEFYLGKMFSLDFSDDNSLSFVNAWAAEHTENLIDSIIERFSEDDVAVIANAIYFSDRWDWEFREEDTKEEVFHSPSGDVNVPFMLRQGDDQAYYEDDEIQAMPLYFSNGGALHILLPRDGDATGLLASMDAEYFNKITSEYSPLTGTLLLPRFSISSDVMDLSSALSAIGLGDLFDRELAPLTGRLVEDDYPVYVSSAVQKAVIKVDEKGTTAAAVTALTMSTTSMPEQTEPFEMICDSPFVFILAKNTYDGGRQILFTGVVNDPQGE